MTVGFVVGGLLVLVDEVDVELEGFLLPLGRFLFFLVTGLLVELVVLIFSVVVVVLVVVAASVVVSALNVRFLRSFRIASNSSKFPLNDATILLTSKLTFSSSSLMPEK